jgi:hypothetical protein
VEGSADAVDVWDDVIASALTHLLVFRAPLEPRIYLTLIRESMTRAATLLKKFCREKGRVSVRCPGQVRVRKTTSGIVLTCTIWSNFLMDSAVGASGVGEVALSLLDGLAPARHGTATGAPPSR